MRILSNQAAGMLLGLLGVTIFGATLPMTHIALEGFSPLYITFARAAIAATAAGAALAVLRRPFPRAHLPALVGVGLGAVFGFPIFSSIAMQTIPASHGGVVLGLLPLLTSIFAALVDGERPGPLFWLCGIAGSLLVAAIILAAIAAPLIATHDPNAIDVAARLSGPSAAHWLGTDNLGRDLWSRLVFGSRIALGASLAVILISLSVGLVLGIAAAFAM